MSIELAGGVINDDHTKEVGEMKNLILKLSLPVFLLTPLAAKAAPTNMTWNGSAVTVLQNLPPFCGNAKTDEGEDCDEGSKNGDRCSSCTQDCRYHWMPADCQEEDTPPSLILDASDLRLRLNENADERLREIL